jgi:hypothetical protein
MNLRWHNPPSQITRTHLQCFKCARKKAPCHKTWGFFLFDSLDTPRHAENQSDAAQNPPQSGKLYIIHCDRFSLQIQFLRAKT